MFPVFASIDIICKRVRRNLQMQKKTLIMDENDNMQEAQARLAHQSECPVRHDRYMSVAFFCPIQTRRTYASSTHTHA